MANESTSAELIQALNNIQAELQRMNQTLSAIAAQGKSAPHASEAPRTSRPAPRSGPAPRGRVGGGYRGSSEMSGGPATLDKEQSFRFTKKKSTGARPKGKPPAKKGDGYPKKPR